jgi:hypothetical protein
MLLLTIFKFSTDVFLGPTRACGLRHGDVGRRFPVFPVLRAENATPPMCGIFYKATVMAVLLFGSEIWNLAPSSLKRLEGFHIRAAWRLAGTGPWQNPDGSWTYPDTDAVMETVVAQYFPLRGGASAAYL